MQDVICIRKALAIAPVIEILLLLSGPFLCPFSTIPIIISVLISLEVTLAMNMK